MSYLDYYSCGFETLKILRYRLCLLHAQGERECTQTLTHARTHTHTHTHNTHHLIDTSVGTESSQKFAKSQITCNASSSNTTPYRRIHLNWRMLLCIIYTLYTSGSAHASLALGAFFIPCLWHGQQKTHFTMCTTKKAFVPRSDSFIGSPLSMRCLWCVFDTRLTSNSAESTIAPSSRVKRRIRIAYAT